MKSNLALRQGNLAGAVDKLQQGRKHAETFGLGFNVTDCDYQLGFLILDYDGEGLTEELIGEGERAFECAIAYYESNVSPDNVYLQNVRDGMARLRQRYRNGGDSTATK
jgi:hypothetical protein